MSGDEFLADGFVLHVWLLMDVWVMGWMMVVACLDYRR
jgi:hypothetical protein